MLRLKQINKHRHILTEIQSETEAQQSCTSILPLKSLMRSLNHNVCIDAYCQLRKYTDSEHKRCKVTLDQFG